MRLLSIIIIKHNKDTMQKEKEFYKPQELADKLAVHIMTIYRYIMAKRLRAYKIGGEFRIDKVEFIRFLESVKTK
jgi:excisionase family DNA binding protein